MKSFSLLLFFAISTASIANIQTFNKNNILACSPFTPQSGDANLYWQLANEEGSSVALEDICIIPLHLIKPTQFAVGLFVVQKKIAKLNDLKTKELYRYLKENPEPIVIGPRGEFYIIDHHHLARALIESKLNSTYGIVLENWYKADEVKFWEHMKEKKWMYLVDENGMTKSVSDLVKLNTVKDLKDDPFRSLAGETRCKDEKKCKDGQWFKKRIPFIEFLWAEHFRKTAAISQALKKYGNDQQFNKVIDVATEEVKRLNGTLPSN